MAYRTASNHKKIRAFWRFENLSIRQSLDRPAYKPSSKALFYKVELDFLKYASSDWNNIWLNAHDGTRPWVVTRWSVEAAN